MRSVKSKFPDNEVSVPSMLTVAQIKDDIAHLIDSGELCLGELCAPYTVVKSSVHDGQLVSVTSAVYGRKIFLREIRQRILEIARTSCQNNQRRLFIALLCPTTTSKSENYVGPSTTCILDKKFKKSKFCQWVTTKPQSTSSNNNLQLRDTTCIMGHKEKSYANTAKQTSVLIQTTGTIVSVGHSSRIF